jgi:hypothetical protein
MAARTSNAPISASWTAPGALIGRGRRADSTT